MKKTIFLSILTIFSAFILTAFAAAKPPAGLNLYEKPDEKSQVIETIAPGSALVPIFNEKNWTKVGDTKTGQVGWVNNETLKQYGASNTTTITKTINTSPGQALEVLQYNSQPLNQQQVEELMKNWKTTQENLNRSFNQMMNQSLYNLNQFLQEFNREQAQSRGAAPAPLSQPMIIIPNKAPSAGSGKPSTPAPQNSVIAPTPPSQ